MPSATSGSTGGSVASSAIVGSTCLKSVELEKTHHPPHSHALADTLMRMDAMIEEMFDPNSYHSHIAPLESSTEAIKIASRAELGVKLRGDKQAQHLATSTLVSTALPKAPLVKTRRELAGSTYPNIHNQLAQIASVPVRQSLLQAARTRPSAEQSSVEAARLVEGMIARPARDPLAKLGSSRRSE